MNRKEAILAMLDGKKVCQKEYPSSYFYYNDLRGFVFCSRSGVETKLVDAINKVDGYELYEEPKKKVKKKVTLYRYTYRTKNHAGNDGFDQSGWSKNSWEEFNKFLFGSLRTLLKTESKEVEYEAEE